MKLYGFFRSGSSHRLRIALNLKGVNVDVVPIDLRKNVHLENTYRALNPQGLVPALQLDDDRVLIQSPAIIEWLEETYPAPRLLPASPIERARVRALAAIVGCDIHPVNNRRILETLRNRFGADDAAVDAWCATWITAGFDAYETLLAGDLSRSTFSFGETPTLADVYLVPQVESARRFKVDLEPYPLIRAIDTACARLQAFQRAAPAMQVDAG